MRGFPAIECRRIRLRRLRWFPRGPSANAADLKHSKNQTIRIARARGRVKKGSFFFFAGDYLGVAEECYQRNSPDNVAEESGQEEVREIAAIGFLSCGHQE